MDGKLKVFLLMNVLVIFLASFVSAEFIVDKEPLDLYNYKDKIEIEFTISPTVSISELLILYLDCSLGKTEVHKEFLVIDSSVEKKIVIPIIREFVGSSIGTCKITYELGSDTGDLTKSFKISDEIKINLNLSEEIRPGNRVKVTGNAFRENGKPVDGNIEVKIYGDEDLSSKVDVVDGIFVAEFLIPKDYKAGLHKVELYAYEKNKFDEITNNGKKESSILVSQVPTNLEISLDNNEIIPGNPIVGKILLRDQTGEKMNSYAYVAIKDSSGEMIEKIEVKTDEFFEYPTEYFEAPGNWEIASYSEELINRINLKILENREISVDIVNQTVFIKNVGNVFYNDTVLVEIGDEIVDIPVAIDVLGFQKYSLSAPRGQYVVRVGNIEKMVSLTGNAIRVEKISDNNFDFVRLIAWTFMTIVLGFVALTFFKKGYQKTFFGRITGKKAKKPLELKELPGPKPLSESKIKAELSLSITGTKQNSPVGCLFLKNYEELQSGQGGVNETINQIASMIENKKGVVYENKGNLFFMIPPVRTKTFKNELPLLELSQDIQKLLNEHNKKFKQKIDFGIGLNFGTIVTNENLGKFKFMSMGSLMTDTKKLANKSSEHILFTDKFKARLPENAKTEKVSVDGIDSYRLVEMKIKSDNSAFINNFLKKTYNK